MPNILERFTKSKLNKKDYFVDISPIVSPTGDFGRLEKLNVILNSWLNILTTPLESADHDSLYGCGIQKYLFKQNDSTLLETVKDEIYSSLVTYDNRCKITNISVNFLTNMKGLSINIYAEYEGETGRLFFTATENSFIIHET